VFDAGTDAYWTIRRLAVSEAAEWSTRRMDDSRTNQFCRQWIFQ